jgi:hypothetical protein
VEIGSFLTDLLLFEGRLAGGGNPWKPATNSTM